MVGVPGRSRACQPCKKRRVACDLRQPTCTRCTKAKRECVYGNDRIFVLNDEGSHKTIYRKRDCISERPSIETSEPPANGAITNDEPFELIYKDGSTWPDTVTQALLLQKPKEGAVMQQALIGHALDGDLVHGTPTIGTLASAITNGVMGTCLQYPFLACYTSWLGRKQQNQRLVDASREFYIHALKETQTALVAPQTAYADATLAACNALGIYEALECPGGTMKAYYWHRAASYRLVQLRGPEAHQDGAAHRLFTNFRFFGILHAFDNGHETFLASPEWLTIPFLVHPKTKFDELVDIFAMGAEPSSLGKSIERLPEEEVLPTALQIVGKLSIIRQKLQTFYSELEEASTKALYWERIAPPRSDALSSSSSDDYHSDFVFPPMLWFESLEAASMLSLYWAIQTMVWSGLSDLYSLFSEHGVAALFNAAVGESSDFTPQSMHFMWLDRARKVLQSVAFCTTKKALEAGPPRCTTQLAIVVDVMKSRKGCEAEFRWALRALKQMGKRWLRVLNTFPLSEKEK